MKKRCLLFMIICIIILVLGVLFFFMLNCGKTTDIINIDTKNELMNLFDLANLDCDVLSIKVNETEVVDTDNSDSTTIVVTLSVSSKSIIKDERFNIQYQPDNDYEHIFNEYSLSIQQFDAVGSFFNEISIRKNRGILYMPYEIRWGVAYDSADTYSMVVFSSIPQNIAFDIESILTEE